MGKSQLNCSLFALTRALALESLIASAVVAVYAADCCKVSLPLLYYLAVLSITWMVYLVDHMLDARSLPDESQCHRILVNRHNVALLNCCLVLAPVGLACGLLCLDLNELSVGFIIGLLCLFYFLGVQINLIHALQKELLLAAIYVLGISYVPLLRSSAPKDLVLWSILPMAISVYTNMLTCSLWDFHADFTECRTSTVQYLGAARARRLIFGLVLGGLLLIFATPFNLFWHTLPVCIPLCACAAISGISFNNLQQKHSDWLRMLADLSYLGLLAARL